ncbi:RcnB family protein [Massilia sp. CMS3.1]|uniref:RcnB family protein n=1 Tax=Massilia sp. CMS3.1 TaxID=3373083 RepID=UPI003EE4F22B
MKKNMIARAMIAVMLAVSLPAIAQDRSYQQDRREYRNEQREDRRDAREERREDRRDARDDRRDERRDNQARNRGAGPRHDLHRGQRLPSNYNNRHYVVDNWRSHRLSAPPRGHHWVQVGNDYVLAAVATGLIASIFLGN